MLLKVISQGEEDIMLGANHLIFEGEGGGGAFFEKNSL